MKTSGSMVWDGETYHTTWYVSTPSTAQAVPLTVCPLSRLKRCVVSDLHGHALK
jgi:hypothetical protein